ncbi:uncharacterized protein [Euwallacea fornicatus]|uniref:uncharacterized protein n=1 Tax=Euwallacea fornicatus TaxID=995702 RepID=UPI00338E9947
MTQFMTGHGCFTDYLKRFGIIETDECWYCGEKDDVEHTFFKCENWRENRELAEEELEEEIMPENVVEAMLASEKNWTCVEKWIAGVMKQKELDERRKKLQEN